MPPFRVVSRRFLRRVLNTLPIVLPSALGLAFAVPMQAQAPAAPAAPSDVIIFTNGDQLTGKLLREVAGSVTFHSDIAGDVSVTWDKIKSIKTGQQFAVIQQGQHVTRKTADADIVQGNVQVEDNQVEVNQAAGAASKNIPVKDAQYVIDKDTYTKELRGNPGFFSGWASVRVRHPTRHRGDEDQYPSRRCRA
jgi:hypothetical protein